MNLTEEERAEIIEMIKAGTPLPTRYRATLFDDIETTELVWPGKTSDVERTVLPFQSIEHIDEPRSGNVAQADLFSMDSQSGRQSGGWTNKLIWGDNKLILSSLANGPMRRHIEDAGGLKLVYIDPPFDVGADFSMDVEIGGEDVTKKPSVVEEVAYRDTWGRGRDSFLAMLLPRLLLARDLLSEDGSIYVHVDWRLSGQVRLLMDEVFGPDHLRNEIAWCYTSPGRSPSRFKPCHDTLLYYSKGVQPIWTNPQQQLAEATLKVTSLKFKGQQEEWTRSKNTKDMVDWWEIIFHTGSSERIGYPTQKPEALLARVVDASSRPGDLVADFFCGSGTTLAVAEKMGRKWIGADLGRFAIHTSRKRLIKVQRELQAEGKPYRAFEILNLGSYERQYFTGIDPNLPADQKAALTVQKRDQFLELVLTAFTARRSEQLPPFHGTKGDTAVFVGPLDAPVTQDDVRSVVDAARTAGIARADILGFEFEMGISPAMADEARELGVSLTLRYIPRDVFDKRAIAKNQVTFYEVGYVELKPVYDRKNPLSVSISVEDFGVFYAQEDADAAAQGLKRNSSKVVVDGGQVVRVAKDKKGVMTREVLTKKWSDWIDYWAVDFDYESQKEIISITEGDEVKQVWTGRYVFENEWQAFRTRKDRELELVSAANVYETPGTYRVAVKIIDVFGNDTTKVIPVKVG